MTNGGWNPKKGVFSADNGADRYRSVVSSSFRQGPVNSLNSGEFCDQQ
ncbi:MAG: hypothetical protein ACYSOF_09620 [Planctomycetota bacterium]|jgi:hypothetical protein